MFPPSKVRDADRDSILGKGLLAVTATETAARNQSGQPGKFIPVDNTDLTGTGVPDFDPFYQEAPPTLDDGAGFVPMTITLPDGWDPNSTQFQLSYSGSDPNGVTTTGSGTQTDPLVYHPASGTLRIWDANEFNYRTESDYLAPDAIYSFSQVFPSYSYPVAIVFVEAVAPSQGIGDQTISIKLINAGGSDEGQVMDDSVMVTAIQTTVAVDANRDGSINFDGSEATSTNSPYQFWLDTGMDATVWNGDTASYESSAGDSAYMPNLLSKAIVNQSDLENFAHLEVQVPMGATDSLGDLEPGWSASVQYTSDTGSATVWLVPLGSAFATNMMTYMNDPTATLVLGGRPSKTRIATGARIEGSATEQPAELPVVPGTQSTVPGTNTAYLNYLFEGALPGNGDVVVTWNYHQNAIVQNGFYLQLMPVNQMYETVSAITAAMMINNTANGLGDLRSSSAPLIPTIMPTLENPSGAQIMTVTNPYTFTSPQTNQVIVFVHGWRMKLSEMEAYADTVFKRLYWQGYTGRLVAFQWPTQWTDTDSTGWNHPIGDVEFAGSTSTSQNYDRSDQIAYTSGQSLYNLLTNLDAQYGAQNINIIAHSMGNVVTSQALRLAATEATPVQLVSAYIASQAATPADAYDPSVIAGSDIYSDFLGTGPYYGMLNRAAPQMYNFYNPEDIAVGTGATGRWNLNNGGKPDRGYDYVETAPDRAPPPYIVYVRKGNDFGLPTGPVAYDNPITRYEAFAFAALSLGHALGGTANVGGPFNTAKQVNLNAQFNFQSDHSGEFDGTEQWRSGYWLQVMNDFQLHSWTQ